MSALVRIIAVFFAKVSRGITPAQASGEALKALRLHFPDEVGK